MAGGRERWLLSVVVEIISLSPNRIPENVERIWLESKLLVLARRSVELRSDGRNTPILNWPKIRRGSVKKLQVNSRLFEAILGHVLAF